MSKEEGLTVEDLLKIGDNMGVVMAVLSELGLLQKFEEEKGKVYEPKEPLLTRSEYEKTRKRVLSMKL